MIELRALCSTIKTFKKLKINGETVARMQEMAHRAHVFKKKIWRHAPDPPPPVHPGARILHIPYGAYD